jgi:hypothetical protein
MSYLYTRLYMQFDVLQMTYRLRVVHARGMYHITSLSHCSGNIAKSPPAFLLTALASPRQATQVYRCPRWSTRATLGCRDCLHQATAGWILHAYALSWIPRVARMEGSCSHQIHSRRRDRDAGGAGRSGGTEIWLGEWEI